MKNLLIIAAMLVSINCAAQSPVDTSMRVRMEQMEQDMATMKANLSTCHNRYSTGLSLQLISLAGAGAAMYWGGPKLDGLSVGLLCLSGVGAIIMIDSHKFIMRASGIEHKN